MSYKLLLVPAVAVLLTVSSGQVRADSFLVDLTHPIPTFKPTEGDPITPDLSQPYLDSKAIPTFGQQTTFELFKFETGWGYFDIGRMVLSEHHGTHIDSAAHFVQNDDQMRPDGQRERPLVHKLGAEDLIGPAVLIDISGRVQSELDKNGGKPSPDKSVTDFSNSSPNVVTADDIAAVADDLGNGAWLVLNTGWSKFFFEGTDFAKDPYINGWNHPGMNHEAVDKLIEVARDKGIKINGVIADNIGVDSGESAIGIDDKWTDSWYAHVHLFQYGIKFVENAANLGLLAQAEKGSCTIIVGAPKHVRGTGGPSRVLAMCEK